MDRMQAAAKFEAKGHPGGMSLDTRQKMLYLRLEIIYADMATEIIEYSANNEFRDQAIELLHQSKQKALASVVEESKAAAKTGRLVADGEPKQAAQPVAKSVINEVKPEETVIPTEEKPEAKRRGRPKKAK